MAACSVQEQGEEGGDHVDVGHIRLVGGTTKGSLKQQSVTPLVQACPQQRSFMILQSLQAISFSAETSYKYDMYNMLKSIPLKWSKDIKGALPDEPRLPELQDLCTPHLMGLLWIHPLPSRDRALRKHGAWSNNVNLVNVSYPIVSREGYTWLKTGSTDIELAGRLVGLICRVGC